MGLYGEYHIGKLRSICICSAFTEILNFVDDITRVYIEIAIFQFR